MLRWYLIHTKPLSEGVAQTNLERQGYETYVPRATQAVRCHGHWQDRIVALFPRYLFLRLNEGRQSLGPVRFTMGVASVVRFGSKYTIVPDQVIRDLRARADPATKLHRLGRVAAGPRHAGTNQKRSVRWTGWGFRARGGRRARSGVAESTGAGGIGVRPGRFGTTASGCVDARRWRQARRLARDATMAAIRAIRAMTGSSRGNFDFHRS